MRYIIRWVIRLLISIIARVDLYDLDRIPRTGAFVIATNHLGLLDAVLLFYGLDRWDVFIPTAEKRQDKWFFRWLGKYLNFVFIDRFNPDLKAMRRIIKLMEEGNILVIAPEGTRSHTGALQEGKAGVSYLAAKLNRPIVPGALTGTEDEVIIDNLKHLRRSHIVARVGEPFALPPLSIKDRDAALKADTDEIMCRIAALLPPKYRGVYADHPRLKELLAGSSD
ncbi:MAG TPA: lysophospholipid acyltransferase family protein [Anaerolineales bacterium]|nr:lysophospholipid acyltransferase family protein [Anaerolineales bacterium]